MSGVIVSKESLLYVLFLISSLFFCSTADVRSHELTYTERDVGKRVSTGSGGGGKGSPDQLSMQCISLRWCTVRADLKGIFGIVDRPTAERTKARRSRTGSTVVCDL